MIAAFQILCFVVITICAVALFRGWRRTRLRLLLFSAIGFTGMAINNLFVVAGAVTGGDYSTWRSLPTLAGLIVMIWGFAGERDR